MPFDGSLPLLPFYRSGVPDDDTVLYFASNSVSEIEDVLNCDLHLLQTWLLDNNLFRNKKKTEFVLFGTSARLSRVGDCTVNIGDHLVKRVLNFKYLGLVLDDARSWNCHLNKYCLYT